MDPALMLHQTRIEFSSMSSKIASKLSHLWVFHIQIIMGKPLRRKIAAPGQDNIISNYDPRTDSPSG